MSLVTMFAFASMVIAQTPKKTVEPAKVEKTAEKSADKKGCCSEPQKAETKADCNKVQKGDCKGEKKVDCNQTAEKKSCCDGEKK